MQGVLRSTQSTQYSAYKKRLLLSNAAITAKYYYKRLAQARVDYYPSQARPAGIFYAGNRRLQHNVWQIIKLTDHFRSYLRATRSSTVKPCWSHNVFSALVSTARKWGSGLWVWSTSQVRWRQAADWVSTRTGIPCFTKTVGIFHLLVRDGFWRGARK